jgi:hypothetical protein
MSTNRDLLKEAIADAKAVKETAIANAKAALEEAFTPYLREKLSAKLSEMEEVEEAEEVKEEMYDEAEKMMEEEESMDEISLDELLAELEEEKMEESIFEAKEEEAEEMSIEDMSEDDLKSFIESVIKDMVAAGELEAGNEGGEEEEMEMEPEEGEEMEMEDEEELDEEIDINELLAEDEDEEVSLDELLAELEMEEGYSKKVKDSSPKSKNAIFNKGGDEYMTDSTEEDDEEYSADTAEKISFYEMELEEAYEAINTLKSELNEINLLNAKLLYTNKIFRNKSLTESQKVKVLTAFDKATSKKEAQLVYETLLENLKTPVKKSPIQESLGSASKSLGTAKSAPIIENDAFSRMRELAGIKKSN